MKKLSKKEKEIIKHRVKESELTYGELLKYLKKLTKKQLEQPVQILPPNPTPDDTLLEPVVSIGTIEELCHNGEEISQTKSSIDFKHHPESIVLLRDYCDFDEEGNAFFTLEEKGWRGNKTGKLHKFESAYLGKLSKKNKKK